MPAEIKHNLITFRLPDWTDRWVYLTGDDVSRRGGLEPDAWTFTLSFMELEKLSEDGGPLDVVNTEIEGVVELWYTNAPAEGVTADVTLGNVAIVDISPDLIGRSPGDSADKILSYQITITDHRRAFVEPRGGRLFDGLLNRDPLPAGDTLLTNKQLMERCAAAIGVTLTVPTSVNDAEPLREVDWQAAHAPSALQELLEHTGHVYAPLISGQAQVIQPGVGAAPTVPGGRLVRTVTSRSVDRRPREAIIVSAPNAKILTYRRDSELPPAWTYVMQDPDDDEWKPLGDIAILASAGGAADVWAKQFDNLTENHKARVREQLYCCIQLDPTKFPPAKVNLLPRWFDTDLVPRVPGLFELDLLVTQRADGSYGPHNDEQPVLARQIVPEANVMIFPHPLLQMTTAGADLPNINGSNTIPFPEADIKPTFSVEAWDLDNDRIDYGTYGFSVSGVSLTTMTESAAKEKLTGYRPNTAVYESPDLVHVVVDPAGAATTNRAAMVARAETYARNLVRMGTPAMQVMTIKGFLQVELTGAVSEVSYDAGSVTTTVTLNGWHVTSRCGGDAIDIGGGSGGISRNVTRQRSRSRSASSRRAQRRTNVLGTNRNAKGVEPAQATTRDAIWPELYLVTGMSPISGMKGRYNASFMTWLPNAAAAGDLAAANIGGAAGTCEVWHPGDIGNPDAPTLTSSSILLAIRGPVHTSRNKMILVTVGAPGGGGTLPEATAPYQVLTALPNGSGGYNYVFDFPRIWPGA